MIACKVWLSGVLSDMLHSKAPHPLQPTNTEQTNTNLESSVGSDVTWELRGTAIDPRVWHTVSLIFGYEIVSTVILPLPLIQEEQLSVNGERMCAKYWLPASGRFAQELCG